MIIVSIVVSTIILASQKLIASQGSTILASPSIRAYSKPINPTFEECNITNGTNCKMIFKKPYYSTSKNFSMSCTIEKEQYAYDKSCNDVIWFDGKELDLYLVTVEKSYRMTIDVIKPILSKPWIIIAMRFGYKLEPDRDDIPDVTNGTFGHYFPDEFFPTDQSYRYALVRQISFINLYLVPTEFKKLMQLFSNGSIIEFKIPENYKRSFDTSNLTGPSTLKGHYRESFISPKLISPTYLNYYIFASEILITSTDSLVLDMGRLKEGSTFQMLFSSNRTYPNSLIMEENSLFVTNSKILSSDLFPIDKPKPTKLIITFDSFNLAFDLVKTIRDYQTVPTFSLVVLDFDLASHEAAVPGDIMMLAKSGYNFEHNNCDQSIDHTNNRVKRTLNCHRGPICQSIKANAELWIKHVTALCHICKDNGHYSENCPLILINQTNESSLKQLVCLDQDDTTTTQLLMFMITIYFILSLSIAICLYYAIKKIISTLSDGKKKRINRK